YPSLFHLLSYYLVTKDLVFQHELLGAFPLECYILPLIPNVPLFTQNVRFKKGESDYYAILVQHVGKAELISWSYSRSVSYSRSTL
ncbi:MAG: hypothetical protein WA667_10260, partial [Candidatus Nitrosopolaris sp.]